MPETVTASDPVGRDTATRIVPAFPTVRARLERLDDVGIGIDRHVAGAPGSAPVPTDTRTTLSL